MENTRNIIIIFLKQKRRRKKKRNIIYLEKNLFFNTQEKNRLLFSILQVFRCATPTEDIFMTNSAQTRIFPSYFFYTHLNRSLLCIRYLFLAYFLLMCHLKKYLSEEKWFLWNNESNTNFMFIVYILKLYRYFRYVNAMGTPICVRSRRCEHVFRCKLKTNWCVTSIIRNVFN